MIGTILLIGRFFVQVLVGAVLFLLIASVAWGLSEATELLKARNTPWHLWFFIEVLSEAVFAVDAVCFIAFISIEAYMLIGLMYRNARAEWRKGNDEQ
jgi:hypothetical protein